MTLLSVRREVGEFKKRYRWMALAVALAMGSILARLVWLQVFEHERWAAEAQDNITKHIRLPATRGLIRDAQGKVVASNRPSYDAFMTPSALDPEHIDLFAQLMGFNRAQKQAFVDKLAAAA